MSRMFMIEGKRLKTWNPIVGCYHNCIYCYARKWAKRQKHRCALCYCFLPHLHRERLERIPRSSLPIFVCDMGDLFGSWIPKSLIKVILRKIEEYKDQEFLLLTKNPKRYLEFSFPSNVILGATIETDSPLLYFLSKISRAPLVDERIEAMVKLKHDRKMISIEPIIRFSTDFWVWITRIKPEFVYIGYCNPLSLAKKLRLPEPKLSETLSLISKLREQGIEVREKTIRKAWYEI